MNSYKIIVGAISVLISFYEVIVSQDAVLSVNSISGIRFIVFALTLLFIIALISFYSSQRNPKYFLSIFFSSLGLGYLITIFFLLVFSKIDFNINYTEINEIKLLVMPIIKFGMLPALGIAISFISPRKPRMKGLSFWPDTTRRDST